MAGEFDGYESGGFDTAAYTPWLTTGGSEGYNYGGGGFDQSTGYSTPSSDYASPGFDPNGVAMRGGMQPTTGAPPAAPAPGGGGWGGGGGMGFPTPPSSNSSAPQQAARQQVAATNNANATLGAAGAQGQQGVAPYNSAGQLALGDMMKFLGLGGPTGAGGNMTAPGASMFMPADMLNDPGYAFRQQEGQHAIMNNRSASGGINSGATLRSLQDYAQGLASQEYGSSFNRWTTTLNSIFNRLAGLTGPGLSAANSSANIGQNTASQQAGNQVGAGNALASGTMGAANAGNNDAAAAYNAWITNQMMQRMGGGSSPTAGLVPGTTPSAPAPAAAPWSIDKTASIDPNTTDMFAFDPSTLATPGNMMSLRDAAQFGAG